MTEFLQMGGYAPYVWSAYGITLLVLLLNIWSARRARLRPLGFVANSEIVAVEIFRTLVGSIGLVVAVPFTTWLAATVATRNRP